MSPGQGRSPRGRGRDRAGLPLKIAGKMREPASSEYFDEFVEPHLDRADRVPRRGPHGEKVELLQHARVTLFPIEWEEPFGS